MSHFQRTRSKVWWGDSPQNINSPVAHPSNREPARQQANNDWEPQIPQWISPRVEESPSPLIRRLSSPISHKSQDSGFSDSDSSSPAVGQNGLKVEDKDLEVKSPHPETPKSNKTVDTPIKSITKTPKEVQKHLQVQCDDEQRSFDLKRVADNECSVEILKNASRQMLVTPHRNINNNNTLEKGDAKKKLFNNNSIDSNGNIEYIQVSPSHQVAVNNQPRMRSPITGISCKDSFYFRVNSEVSDGNFQRNRLNKSLNYKSQRLDEQILNDGPHSLSCIEAVQYEESNLKMAEAAKSLSTRKITDSLNLKTPKKSLSRSKQKLTKSSKQKYNKGFFNFLPKKNDSFKTIYDITRDVSEDRVPTLGLPNASGIGDDWVLVGDQDLADIQNEDSIKVSDNNILNVSKSPKSILKTSTQIKIKENNNVVQSAMLEDDLHFSEMEFNAFTSTPKMLPLRGRKDLQVYFEKNETPRMKPVNLLSNFNESVSSFNFPAKCESPNARNNGMTALEKVSTEQSAPVKHWLCELVGLYEPECMTTLQSKALGLEFNTKVANSSSTITGNIRKVQTHGQIIAHQFRQVMKDLRKTNSYDIQHCRGEITMMTANISEFVLAHSITLKIKPPGETPDRWDKIKVALQDNIQKVTDINEDINIELNETYPEFDVLQKYLKILLNIFLETARAVLVQQMRTLVSMLEDPPSDMILKSTLISLGHLGALMSPEDDLLSFDGNEMNFITKLPFVECGVPRALLSVIIESNKSSIKALSLRALATICILSEAVEQFEEAGGMEILSEVLGEESNPEPQMKEAVTVLTQITGPWLQGAYKLKQLDLHLEAYIKNITVLLSKTSCCQLLLLCTACLVNLVNIIKQKDREQISLKDNNENHCDIIEILSQHKTIENLLESVKKRGPKASIFLQEQTATFINILSSSSKGQVLLASCPATAVALVCFLRIPCTSPARSARLQAEFRLINQSTEALARLCSLPEITIQVIQLEGVTRLVRVIEAQKLQKADVKCSDKILVNCLRALRAIAKNHSDCFEDIDCDVTNMITPTLMESVKYYSARQESYV